MRRMASAAAAKKCPRLSQCWAFKRLEEATQQNRQELAALDASRKELQDQRRKALAEGKNSLATVEAKLAKSVATREVVAGRLVEIEGLISGQVALAKMEIAEAYDSIFAAFEEEYRRERDALEKEILSSGPAVLQLVRLITLAETRARQMRAFQRRMQEGQAGQVVREFLEKPARAAEPAAAAAEVAG
jgi:hypothetical protein